MSNDRSGQLRFERAPDLVSEHRRVLANLAVAESYLRSGRSFEALEIIGGTLRPPVDVRGPDHGSC